MLGNRKETSFRTCDIESRVNRRRWSWSATIKLHAKYLRYSFLFPRSGFLSTIYPFRCSYLMTRFESWKGRLSHSVTHFMSHSVLPPRLSTAHLINTTRRRPDLDVINSWRAYRSAWLPTAVLTSIGFFLAHTFTEFYHPQTQTYHLLKERLPNCNMAAFKANPAMAEKASDSAKGGDFT